MRINKAFGTMALVTLLLYGCSGNLASQGTSLEPIIAEKGASIGKTYTITLRLVNIERNRQGAYLRLFDEKYNTIFVYVSKENRNKVANLVRNSTYIYKFKITKNDQYTTLSAALNDVADEKGKPISGKLKDPKPGALLIKLDGSEAVGKEFSLPLNFKNVKEENGRKIFVGETVDDYRNDIFLSCPDALEEKIGGLKSSDKITVKFKVDKVETHISGSLLSIE